MHFWRRAPTRGAARARRARGAGYAWRRSLARCRTVRRAGSREPRPWGGAAGDRKSVAEGKRGGRGWRDGSKKEQRDQAEHARGERARVLGKRGVTRLRR